MGAFSSSPSVDPNANCPNQEPRESKEPNFKVPKNDRKSPASQSIVRNTKVPLECKMFLRERTGRVFDYFEKIGDLGEGSFGDVWLARQRIRAGTAQETAGRTVAIKRIRKPNSTSGVGEDGADSEESIDDFRTEIELMKALDHPAICRLLQVFEDSKNLYLVMEHLQGGELFDRIDELGCFGESQAAQVVHEVSSALSYCHHNHVVHRDIKPENILLVHPDDPDDLTIKLIDFGFGSKILKGARLKPKVGTFMYTAPEALKQEPCDEKVDMWALGCMVFVLLSGNSPFYGSKCMENMITGSFEFEGSAWDHVSEEAKALIRRLLDVNPRTRMAAKEVHKDPWLQINAHPKAPEKAMKQHFTNLKRFHRQNKFRMVCAGVLAKQMDESVLHDLHATFESIDVDEDGIITMDEFKKAWGDSTVSAADEDVTSMFHDTDMNGDGVIDYTEFIAACFDRKIKQQEEVCWAAFRVFDLDGSGDVSFAAFREVLTSATMEQTFSKETLRQLWQQLSGESQEGAPNDDDRIDFDHFLAAIRGIQPSAISPASCKKIALREVTSPGVGIRLPIMQKNASLGPILPIAKVGDEDSSASSRAAPMLPIAKLGGEDSSAGGVSSDQRPSLPIAMRRSA